MNIKEMQMYVNNFKDYCELFGEEIVVKHLTPIDYRSFTTTQNVKELGRYYTEKGYYNKRGSNLVFKDYKIYGDKEYESTSYESGYEVTVPSSYQGYKHGSFIKTILLELYPYLHNYNFDCYAMSGEVQNYEIYLKTKGEGHIYIPVIALKEKDITIIFKRMQDYWSWYYRGREEEFNKCCTIPLSSKTFNQLAKDIISFDANNIKTKISVCFYAVCNDNGSEVKRKEFDNIDLAVGYAKNNTKTEKDKWFNRLCSADKLNYVRVKNRGMFYSQLEICQFDKDENKFGNWTQIDESGKYICGEYIDPIETYFLWEE